MAKLNLRKRSSAVADAVRSHYEVLGVPPGATTEEIRAAYLRIARTEAHPDKGGDKDEFIKYNVAYTNLKDPRTRLAHDDMLRLRGVFPELCVLCCGRGVRVRGAQGAITQCPRCLGTGVAEQKAVK